jgi:hypothetical protein
MDANNLVVSLRTFPPDSLSVNDLGFLQGADPLPEQGLSIPDDGCVDPSCLTIDSKALTLERSRSRPWGAFPQTRRRRLRIPSDFKVLAPKKHAPGLRISDSVASDRLGIINEIFTESGQQETIWLDQMSRLLQIAEQKVKRSKNQGASREARNALIRYRQAVGQVLWAFSRSSDTTEESGTLNESWNLESLAEEITSLTLEAFELLVHNQSPFFLYRQKEALRKLLTFKDATSALENSDVLSVGGGSLHSFIARGGASTFMAEDSQG